MLYSPYLNISDPIFCSFQVCWVPIVEWTKNTKNKTCLCFYFKILSWAYYKWILVQFSLPQKHPILVSSFVPLYLFISTLLDEYSAQTEKYKKEGVYLFMLLKVVQNWNWWSRLGFYIIIEATKYSWISG